MDSQSDDGDGARTPDDEKAADPPSRPPQREIALERALRAVDDLLFPRPPSKLSPPARLSSFWHRRRHAPDGTNGAVETDCPPDRAHQRHTQREQPRRQQPQAGDEAPGRRPRQNAEAQESAPSRPRHQPFALLSAAIHSTIASGLRPHRDVAETTRQRPPRPFFSFASISGSWAQWNSSAWAQLPTGTSSPRFSVPLLYGCSDRDQHGAVISTAVHVFNLYLSGHDVDRFEHGRSRSDPEASVVGDSDENGAMGRGFDRRARNALSSLGFEFRPDPQKRVTRLRHVPSDTAVDGDNRRTFIADGEMYDAIAGLCQSAAQEIMAESCDLAWVTIHELNPIEGRLGDERGSVAIREPIRALVGKLPKGAGEDRPKDTLLVATGKGKVRAGIFSRHHLLTTGLEPSTALPLLREARDRGMNCVVIDPNARGDMSGMDTFEASIHGLFEARNALEEEEDGDHAGEHGAGAIIPENVDGPIYVLAHSAAGGQLVRYLLDRQALMPRLRCIAFTDSTHSIQWLKDRAHVSSFVQSSRALYVKTANPVRDDGCKMASPGEECPGDDFWSHRFGGIRTVWAGTTDHSLSNWTARGPIWEHFDRFRGPTPGAARESVAEEGNDGLQNGEVAAVSDEAGIAVNANNGEENDGRRNGRVTPVGNKADVAVNANNGKLREDEKPVDDGETQNLLDTKPFVI